MKNFNFYSVMMRKTTVITIGLLTIGLIARLAFISSFTIPFTFDHGKDAIAVLHMVKNFSPKLIGPWTSIPGLFFGPAWYYLLAPSIALSNAHPMAPTITMVIIGLIQIGLLYRFFGFTAAIIAVSTYTWISGSTSAWNPYPMSLILLLLLILFKQLTFSSKNVFIYFLIGLVSGLGFHFSSAYAISFVLSIPLILLLKYRRSITFKSVAVLLVGFTIAFLPQIVFELRNSFIETKAVVTYLTHPELREFAPTNKKPLSSLVDHIKLTIIPGIPNQPFVTSIFMFLTIILIGYGIYKQVTTKKLPTLLFESIILLIPPLIIFSYIHFNEWYWYASVPIITIIASQLINRLPKPLIQFYYLLLIAGLLGNLIYFNQINKYDLALKRDFLPAKLKAIDYIYTTAQNKSFASYQYAPHIYDYDWQYLYFWKALQGYQLPSEFSYKPGEISYITDKDELLTNFTPPSKKPDLVFFIVEKPMNQDYLTNWWNEQQYDKIINETVITPEITVYTALPKK